MSQAIGTPMRLSVDNADRLVSAIEKYGEIIANSKMFGCKNVEQGKALVLMAFSEGLPITEMRRRYHIIGNGDLSPRADWMRSQIREAGWKYRWVKDGDDLKEAVMELERDGEKFQVKFTMEDAQRQKLVKADSGWAKDPGAMLRARVTTKAIRMHIPEILAGYYTQDEYEDGLVIDATSTPIEPAEKFVIPKIAEKPELVSTPAGDQVHDALSEVAGTVASAEQVSRIGELFKAIGMQADDQLAAIQKRGAKDMGSLTKEGAVDLIAGLEAFVAKKQSQADAEATTNAKPLAADATSARVSGPCSEEQANQIRNALRELCQLEGTKDVGDRYREKLKQHGLGGTAELSMEDADKVIAALKDKTLKAFFDLQLQGPSPKA